VTGRRRTLLGGVLGILVLAAVAGPVRAADPESNLLMVQDVERGEILQRLGVASMRLGRYAEAADYFRQAIETGRDGAEIRQSLGVALTELRQCDEAIEQLRRSLTFRHGPRPYLYIARCHELQGRPGLAVYALEQALPDAGTLEPAELRGLYNTLGYLYAGEGERARAASAWERSLALQPDPEISLRLGRTYRLLGEGEKALTTLEGIDPHALAPPLQAERLDELAELYRTAGRVQEAFDALRRADIAAPSGRRSYALGELARRTGRRREAIRYLEEARIRAPDDSVIAVALGYAYKEADRFADAARVFEAAVAREPDRVELYEELGYLNMRMGHNERAIEWFKRAIDSASLRPGTDAGAPARTLGLREEVARLSNRLDVTAYVTYRASARQPASGSVGALGGALPSQSGVEVAYTPPLIGFRDERIFQVYARLLWNLEPRSLDIDGDSVQSTIGIRYKPLRAQNVYLGVERLIAIGDKALNDWLLRVSYSWEWPRSAPGDRVRNYTTIYGDGGYFIDKSIWALYGEARQGVTWALGDRLELSPHVVGDFRYQTRSGPSDSFVEGGPGVSARYLFNETRYAAFRSSVELRVQYKFGRFTEGPGGKRDDFNGLVITAVVHY
jgi:tetratricopeptide (TPR) repeat protein